LGEFLRHGVRYAFPAVTGRATRGVPTAHAGPALRERFDSADALVWPDHSGDSFGPSIAPLYPGATGLPERAPEVYRLLTLVDAIRAGRARERGMAITELDRALAGHRVAGSADA
ncbi:MAG: MarR family transcriptional regulator, partial [Gemmatimonadales bacterium]